MNEDLLKNFDEKHPLFDVLRHMWIIYYLKRNERGMCINELVDGAPSWCHAVLDERIAEEKAPGFHKKY